MENNFITERKLLNEYLNSLPELKERQLLKEQREIKQMEDLVRILDPVNVLRRGYAIARLHGRTINLENQPSANDIIEVETEFNIIKTQTTRVDLKKK